MSDIKSAPPDDLTPCQFGPFVLERRIAVGGTAEVFQARPKAGTRPAAQFVIKRLLADARDKDHFRTLDREAELHRAVSHPNVVTVFGAGMVGDEPYLAIEYVPGVDLHRLLRTLESERRALDPQIAMYVAYSVAQALSAVHSARDAGGAPLNITHGDVSPSNIYLSVRGEVKLGDFGVARAATGSASVQSKAVHGKFGYLAPEQLLGEAPDQRSDLFALGVVFGEMLIGEKVFPGSGRLAVSLSIRESNMEPLRRAEERLPKGAYRVCLRALARNPSERHPSATAFADALRTELDEAAARAALAELLVWARDMSPVARRLGRRLRDEASRRSASGEAVSVAVAAQADGETTIVRRGDRSIHAGVSFPELLELLATGQLRADDEVSLMGEAFRPVSAVPELARYLMPSSAMTTAQLFEPGVPDFTAELAETSMLEVLARMRIRKESGALFVTRMTKGGLPDRKDLYLSSGRLVHVASADREELLGQYAVNLGLVTAEQLRLGLAALGSFGGRLSDALIGLGFIDAKVLFRAIRNQARDRVAALCSWRDGRVQFYRGAEPGAVQFPLDLDLTVPMMAGAMLMARRGQGILRGVKRLHCGRRLADAEGVAESADVPRSLRSLIEGLRPSPSLSEALAALGANASVDQRGVSAHEARAAVVVALALEWARAE